MSMAWQGSEYPLLLVGVDLVPVLSMPWHEKIKRPYLTPPNTDTVLISNMADGSFRCSFANTEAEVLKGLDTQERQVQLVAKTLLTCLKSEPWMPTHLKTFYTWRCGRSWKLPQELFPETSGRQAEEQHPVAGRGCHETRRSCLQENMSAGR